MKRILWSAAIAAIMTGYVTAEDTISKAEKTEKDRPGIAETKAIAEEGFIYGLPLVMNYAVNYEFWLDKTWRPGEIELVK
ncbi:MAG: hypothetical protein WCS70_15705 [Verrucomicrobiota bacterium]